MMKKTWFITGTSRGFGTIIAKAALEAGDNVIGTGRKGSDVTRALGASDQLLAGDLDVNDPVSIEAAVKLALPDLGVSTCWSTTPVSGCLAVLKKRALRMLKRFSARTFLVFLRSRGSQKFPDTKQSRNWSGTGKAG
jgi:NAD(P)-dependent dehydrogenase (short-subunit alcohol dehydrogenase family)